MQCTQSVVSECRSSVCWQIANFAWRWGELFTLGLPYNGVNLPLLICSFFNLTSHFDPPLIPHFLFHLTEKKIFIWFTMFSLFAHRLPCVSCSGSRAGSRATSRTLSPSDFYNFDAEGNNNVADSPQTLLHWSNHRSKHSHWRDKAAANQPASSPRTISTLFVLTWYFTDNEVRAGQSLWGLWPPMRHHPRSCIGRGRAQSHLQARPHRRW